MMIPEPEPEPEPEQERQQEREPKRVRKVVVGLEPEPEVVQAAVAVPETLPVLLDRRSLAALGAARRCCRELCGWRGAMTS
jgi:hypothetical protein